MFCEEACRYVGNFLAVHRVRPEADDASDVANRDDVISDEELVLSNEALVEALQTHIGGRANGSGASEIKAASGTSGHHANSLAAVTTCHEVWGETAEEADGSVPSFPAPSKVGEVLKAARTSQRQEQKFGTARGGAARDPRVERQKPPGVDDVHRWLAELRTRTDGNGRPAANAEQFKAVEKVASRVVQELQDLAADKRSGEPFRELLHSGPGTGKSHVIKLVRELFDDRCPRMEHRSALPHRGAASCHGTAARR